VHKYVEMLKIDKYAPPINKGLNEDMEHSTSYKLSFPDNQN